MTDQLQPNPNTIPEEQYALIIQKICDAAQSDRYFRLENGSVAFSGTKDDPDLILWIAPQDPENDKFYYGISINGETSSLESADFPTADDCIRAVVNSIAPLIHHTVRYTFMQKRFSYIYEATHLLDETTGEWTLLEESYLNHFFLKCFLWKNDSRQWEKKFD